MRLCRRIWELQHSTVCKVVGMAFTDRDLRKIAGKFGIAANDPLMDEEFALHTTVVQLCSTDNGVSRHTEKTIEKRFLIYARKVPFEDPIFVIESVRNRPEAIPAPLWAILWGLATRGRLAEARIENSLFGFVHMLEHRLLRDHWKSQYSRGNANDRAMDKDREIVGLKRDLLDMQWANGRLEKVIGNLRIRIDSSETMSANLMAGPDSGTSKSGMRKYEDSGKVNNLKALLVQAKHCNSELESENAQLRDEIDSLLEEMGRLERLACCAKTAEAGDSCPCPLQLEGRKVALVGGIESLECHYRQLIESFGGRFCRHDGTSGGGEKGLHDCILGSDLVVCPIEVNSHNAAKTVKKICKARGVRCCFPRSASITGLRKAVEEHYANPQVA